MSHRWDRLTGTSSPRAALGAPSLLAGSAGILPARGTPVPLNPTISGAISINLSFTVVYKISRRSSWAVVAEIRAISGQPSSLLRVRKKPARRSTGRPWHRRRRSPRRQRRASRCPPEEAEPPDPNSPSPIEFESSVPSGCLSGRFPDGSVGCLGPDAARLGPDAARLGSAASGLLAAAPLLVSQRSGGWSR